MIIFEALNFIGHLRRRTNQAHRTCEAWQPPAFGGASQSLRDRSIAALRRLLDLQAASIWRDLSLVLPQWQGTVLDVGCGAQPYRGLLNPSVKYIGIDTTDATHFGYRVPDTIYIDAEDDWPVADGSVDAVMSTETLEHVPDPASFLRKTSRALKLGGSLLLTVPFSARYHYIPFDYWRYTPAGLKRLLDSAGFVDCEIYARGNSVTVACYKVMALILPLLMPQKTSVVLGIGMRIVGLALSPVLVTCAVIAHLSLRGRGGDDCLGYTVLARRP